MSFDISFPRPLLALLLIPALLLSGCGSIYSNYREVEQLLLIETMGFDLLPEGVRLTMAAGMQSGGGKGAIRLSGTGGSISAAMDRARNYSFEDELFYSQTNGILIGEEAAEQGIEPFLSYICQSPILRTDVPVFIVRGGSAHEAIMNCGDAQHGVSEILQGVTEYLEYRGATHIFNASELVRSDLRHGSALACVLEYTDSAEPPAGEGRPSQAEKSPASPSPSGAQSSGDMGQREGAASEEEGASHGGDSEGSGAKTLAVAGYGVLKGNRLLAYIDNTQAVGVGFLIDQVGISTVELSDGRGKPVVLEINDGKSHVRPLWNADGSLRKLEISLEASAAVTEINDDADLSDKDYIRQLTEALESYLAEQAGQVLRLSSRLGSDFLSLESRVQQAEPVLTALLKEDFASLLGELEMSLSVNARLSHTNDMKESLT